MAGVVSASPKCSQNEMASGRGSGTMATPLLSISRNLRLYGSDTGYQGIDDISSLYKRLTWGFLHE